MAAKRRWETEQICKTIPGETIDSLMRIQKTRQSWNNNDDLGFSAYTKSFLCTNILTSLHHISKTFQLRLT